MSTVCHHLSHGPPGCQGLGPMVPFQIQILSPRKGGVSEPPQLFWDPALSLAFGRCPAQVKDGAKALTSVLAPFQPFHICISPSAFPEPLLPGTLCPVYAVGPTSV